MRAKLTVLFIGIMALISTMACDNGGPYKDSIVQSITKVKVVVNRQIQGDTDKSLTIYAQGFKRESLGNEIDLLIFQCPCYLGQYGTNGSILVTKEVGELKFETLSGADYDTYVSNTPKAEK